MYKGPVHTTKHMNRKDMQGFLTMHAVPLTVRIHSALSCPTHRYIMIITLFFDEHSSVVDALSGQSDIEEEPCAKKRIKLIPWTQPQCAFLGAHREESTECVYKDE